jgi:hypothetical protein
MLSRNRQNVRLLHPAQSSGSELHALADEQAVKRELGICLLRMLISMVEPWWML